MNGIPSGKRRSALGEVEFKSRVSKNKGDNSPNLLDLSPTPWANELCPKETSLLTGNFLCMERLESMEVLSLQGRKEEKHLCSP